MEADPALPSPTQATAELAGDPGSRPDLTLPSPSACVSPQIAPVPLPDASRCSHSRARLSPSIPPRCSPTRRRQTPTLPRRCSWAKLRPFHSLARPLASPARDPSLASPALTSAQDPLAHGRTPVPLAHGRTPVPKILRNVCDAKQFTYEQLEEATKRFYSEKAMDNTVDVAVYAGVLDDGSMVAVQRIGYETQGKLRLVLDRVKVLSEISHPNIARVVGFCLDSSSALLLVHGHFAGGTLEDHLHQVMCRVLGWHHRVNISIELASALTYLQAHETAPTFLHDLRSSENFLDTNFTAKIAGYKLTRLAIYYSASFDQDVVWNFDHLLIELLTGLRQQVPLDSVAPKVREGRLHDHEVIDPTLLSRKQLPASQDEVRKVFELAVQCLSNAENGLCMLVVVKELLRILRDNNGSSSKIEISLEDTFSCSSLLQMISISPDTLHHQHPSTRANALHLPVKKQERFPCMFSW